MVHGHRSAAIDALRVVAIVAIVAGHLWGGKASEDPPNLLRIALYSWHVPIFFFLAGYFWNAQRALGSEIRTRARTLLLPFAVWTVLLGLIFGAYATLTSGFPLDELLGTLWGGRSVPTIYAAYWFLPVLFLAAVLARGLQDRPWLLVALAVLSLAACYAWGAQLAKAPMVAFFALPCLVFVIAGRELRRIEAGLRSPMLLGGLLLAVPGILLVARVVAPLDIKAGNFGTPVLSVAAAVAICAGLVLLANASFGERDVRWGAFATELAMGSIVLLLTHVALFIVFGSLPIPRPAYFPLVLLIGWSLGFVLRRSRLSLPFTGFPRRAAARRVENDGSVRRGRGE